MTREPWLELVVSAYGEPRVSPVDPATYTGRGKVTEDGVWLSGDDHWEGNYRRAWVWFPTIEGKVSNHFFHIDRYSSHYKTLAGSHVLWKPWVELRTQEPPTHYQIMKVLHLAEFFRLRPY